MCIEKMKFVNSRTDPVLDLLLLPEIDLDLSLEREDERDRSGVFLGVRPDREAQCCK